MRALDLKLFRELRRLWGQSLAIALVVAGGVSTVVLAVGSLRSLEETRLAYYERYQFADVFALVRRAPWTSSPTQHVAPCGSRFTASSLCKSRPRPRCALGSVLPHAEFFLLRPSVSGYSAPLGSSCLDGSETRKISRLARNCHLCKFGRHVTASSPSSPEAMRL